MKKRGVALKGLLGLIIGIAFAFLIITVIFNVIDIFIFDDDEEEKLPDFVEFRLDSLAKRINELEDKEKISHTLELNIDRIFLFFNKDDKFIKVQRTSNVNLIPGSSNQQVRTVSKPVTCGESACICVCSGLLTVSGSIQDNNLKLACKLPAKCEKVDLDNFVSEGSFKGYKFLEGGVLLNSLAKVNLEDLSPEEITLRVYLEKKKDTLGVCLEEPCFN